LEPWPQRALDALEKEGEDADPEWIEVFQEVLNGGSGSGD